MPILTISERRALLQELKRTRTTLAHLARVSGKSRSHLSQAVNGKYPVASQVYSEWMTYLMAQSTSDLPPKGRQIGKSSLRDVLLR